MRKEVIGNATLYLGDARDFQIDAHALLADPPYGIDGGKGGDAKDFKKGAYASAFEDTEDYISSVCVGVVTEALQRVQRGAVTPGNRCLHLYPKAADIGCFYSPAAMTHGPWGFVGFNPILYYGKDHRAGRGALPSSLTVTESAEKNGHPCPKPIRAWRWLLDKVSKPGELVFDPFMGSGTTGVACALMGRSFVGVELHEPYLEIAAKRIEEAYRQADMFLEIISEPETLDLLA